MMTLGKPRLRVTEKIYTTPVQYKGESIEVATTHRVFGRRRGTLRTELRYGKIRPESLRESIFGTRLPVEVIDAVEKEVIALIKFGN